MKKALFAFALTALVNSAFGQDITTTWPYIYDDFQAGKVYFKAGNTMEAPVNIHLAQSKLHYTETGTIKEAQSNDILLVEIGADRYYSLDSRMMKVLAHNENSFLAEVVLADYSRLNSTGGAYGASSETLSTTKSTSLGSGYGAGTNFNEAVASREDGSLLPVNKIYYIVADGEVYPATKKGIESKLSAEQQDAFKAFLKKNKIKWKNPESLVQLLTFFN